MRKSTTFLLLFSLLALTTAKGAGDAEELQRTFNPIYVVAPFVAIAPDARSSGMGDIGVATSPDAYSQHWNASKYPFMYQKMGASLSYTPWLRNLMGDLSIVYGTFYYKLSDQQSVSTSIRYFSIGNMPITDREGNVLNNVSPYEMAIDAAWARKFGENFSLSLTGRYLRSDLTGGFSGTGDGTFDNHMDPGNGFSVDVGSFYTKEHENGYYNIGVMMNNLGNRISYTENADSYFQPMHIKVAGLYSYDIDYENTISLGMDLSKMLVPTPPVRDPITKEVVRGMEDNIPVIRAIFQSFYDAPFGFSEEMSEIMIGTGAEYSYNKVFFVRAGYFHDSKRKGNRRYMTFGAGIKYSYLGLDFSYIRPFTNTDPLLNTIRVSLTFDIGNTKTTREDDDARR